jgi:NADH dehydrogenase [ubiquinone] 1 alpha subcomplex assembly factor 7
MMGLSVRLRSLMEAAGSEKRRNAIYEAGMRLSSPSGMGEEYKVMGITNKSKDTMVWPFSKSDEYDEKPKDSR